MLRLKVTVSCMLFKKERGLKCIISSRWVSKNILKDFGVIRDIERKKRKKCKCMMYC